MIRTAQQWTKFYENLGFLFYSLTCCDRRVTPSEKAIIKDLVNRTWINLEPSLDEYGYDAAYQIEAVTDWLFEEKPSARIAFKRFVDFVEGHPGFIDHRMANIIFSSANSITAASARKNKSELGYLYLLHGILKKATKSDISDLPS
ncbi:MULTISPECIES: hypothetical protein [Sphingobacterium]|uniref:hypothetical protein n=1 Tax=Sphingobacterium TaxID=28453 RepID=UPI0013D92471|nr:MULTISPECIES: hypothetical protein [unclassified Sphingobacterium]